MELINAFHDDESESFVARTWSEVRYRSYAWGSGATLSVHGWVYDVADGLLRDPNLHVNTPEELERLRTAAVEQVKTKPQS